MINNRIQANGNMERLPRPCQLVDGYVCLASLRI